MYMEVLCTLHYAALIPVNHPDPMLEHRLLISCSSALLPRSHPDISAFVQMRPRPPHRVHPFGPTPPLPHRMRRPLFYTASHPCNRTTSPPRVRSSPHLYMPAWPRNSLRM